MKKRGDTIVACFNEKLYHNNSLIIDHNIKGLYVKGKYLKYQSEDANIVIDLKNKRFIRNNQEYDFTLDINNEKIDYTLKSNNIIMYQENVKCSLNESENIILTYEFDGIKKIVISFIRE